MSQFLKGSMNTQTHGQKWFSSRSVWLGVLLGCVLCVTTLVLGSVFSPRAKAVKVLDEYGPNGFTVKVPGTALVSDTVPFVTDALLDANGRPVEGVPVTFSLSRPDESSIQWIQKTDREGRVRGSILTSAFAGMTGSFAISATGEGIPNPGDPFYFYVGERSVYTLDLPQGLSSREVPFPQARRNQYYSASCSANYDTTCWVTNKTTNGFTVNVGTPAGAGAEIIYRVEQGEPIPQ